MKKNTPEVILYCPKCGKTPPRDEKQSNENWSVIPNKCPKCWPNQIMQIKIRDKNNQLNK